MTTEKEMPKFEKQLDTYLRARFTLIVLVTHEEERALQMIRRMCDETHRSCMSWDAADGFQWVSSGTAHCPPRATRWPRWSRSTKWMDKSLPCLC